MRNAGDRNPSRAIFLSILMIIMAQVGYLESINPWTNGEETLDEANDVLESSGSGGFSLSPASTTVTLTNNTAMTPITYQYYSGSGMENGVPVGLMLGGGEYCNMAITIKPRNIMPIQCKISKAVVFSFNESTKIPIINSIEIKPITIPVINGTLDFLPNKPL